MKKLIWRRTLKCETIICSWKPFKNDEKCFLFHLKIFFLKIFKFFSRLFVNVTKLLDKKHKVDFKFYDTTAWLANNRNTHIVQYFEK